jgi:hypothetical protein
VGRHVYPRTVVSVSKHYKNPIRTSSSTRWKLTCSRHDIAENLLSWSKIKITLTIIYLLHGLWSIYVYWVLEVCRDKTAVWGQKQRIKLNRSIFFNIKNQNQIIGCWCPTEWLVNVSDNWCTTSKNKCFFFFYYLQHNINPKHCYPYPVNNFLF